MIMVIVIMIMVIMIMDDYDGSALGFQVFHFLNLFDQ